MIDVKQLRIGNYVIDKGDNNLYQIPSGVSIDASQEMLPIPITEEWLLKFGAFKAKNNWFRLTAMPSMNKEIITIHINTSSFRTSCFGDEALEPCFFKECEYVHQLQNLYFALTGEELTLNQ